MKNKVLIGSLITTLLAFILYSANLKRTENASLQIVGSKTHQVFSRAKNKKVASHEPDVSSIEYNNQIKVVHGSDRVWTHQIAQIMGKERPYQVYVQDLNSGKFADISNTVKPHVVNESAKLFLLTTIFYQEQHGKLSGKSVIKIKKSDQVKSEKLLQPGIGYAITYLKQAMMNNNQTAAKVLLRKINPVQVTLVARKMGATHTTFTKNSKNVLNMQTTAKDMALVLANLYRNKTLNQRNSNQVLNDLHISSIKPKIAVNISGTVYAIGDGKASTELVQTHGNSYCVSVWSNSDRNLTELGQSVNRFFK